MLRIQRFQKIAPMSKERLGDAIVPVRAWIQTQMEKMKGEDMLCDACGKSMAMPGGEANLIGIQVEVIVLETEDEPTRQWYVKQTAPFEVNRKYRVCFSCLLHSLGVCPTRPVDSPMPDDPLIVY